MGAGFSRINDLTIIQSTQVPLLFSISYYFSRLFPTALTCAKNMCVSVPWPGFAFIPVQMFSRPARQRCGRWFWHQRSRRKWLQQPAVTAQHHSSVQKIIMLAPPWPETKKCTSCVLNDFFQDVYQNSFCKPESKPGYEELRNIMLCLVHQWFWELYFSLAKLTAAVMLSRDVPVHLFSTFVPTPYVVRKHYHIDLPSDWVESLKSYAGS